MQDLFGFPGDDARFQTYYATTGLSTDWQVWEKPRGISLVTIILIGAGAGGGGGFSAASGARGGGGGGGCGSFESCVIPALVLPDKLYVQAGLGGLGGAAGIIGNAGATTSKVSVYNGTGAGLVVAASANGGAGGAGTGSGAAAAGLAGSAQSVGQGAHTWGVPTGFAGIAGGTGGTAGDNPGGAPTVWSSGPCTGGGGGGSTNTVSQVGGGIVSTDTSVLPTNPGGAIATDGGNGSIWQAGTGHPLLFMGGAGGGSSTAGAAGNGGRGAIGCGGGGGGAGVTGGVGGNGGPGLVVIVCS